MTREELIELVGDEDQADYALIVLLRQIKPGFLKSAISAELKEVEAAIEALRAEGIIRFCNGTDVPFRTIDNYDNARDKLDAAEVLLYRRRRLVAMTLIQ